MSIKTAIKSKTSLEDLIEQATVDCYDEDERRCSFATILEDELKFPFPAKIAGQEIKVIGVSQKGNQIQVVFSNKSKKYTANILDLEINANNVTGAEWLEAYRKWEMR